MAHQYRLDNRAEHLLPTTLYCLFTFLYKALTCCLDHLSYYFPLSREFDRQYTPAYAALKPGRSYFQQTRPTQIVYELMHIPLAIIIHRAGNIHAPARSGRWAYQEALSGGLLYPQAKIVYLVHTPG